MSKWAQSLIRLSSYEVETLQKRLAEISTRRASAEMRVAVLDAEHQVERERAAMDAYASMQLAAYVQGWKLRRTTAVSVLDDDGKRHEIAASPSSGRERTETRPTRRAGARRAPCRPRPRRRRWARWRKPSRR